ncbi:MAG: hypothetical protein RL095_3644 [Verrucomicrobiota bacterium]|jgi:hypothetical protein
MRLAFFAACGLSLLPACGTVTAPVLGLSTGGPSLCGKVWDDSDSTASKVVTAVPLTIGGAVAGTVYGLGYGLYDDYKTLELEQMRQRWNLYCDPFESQWSTRSDVGAPAGVYTVYLDGVIVTMVKLEEESPYGEIVRLALEKSNVTKSLEALEGLSTWQVHGQTLLLISTKQASLNAAAAQEAAQRKNEVEAAEAKKKQEAEAAELAARAKREAELVAQYGPMRTWHLHSCDRTLAIPERMLGIEREEWVRSHFSNRLSDQKLTFNDERKLIFSTLK